MAAWVAAHPTGALRPVLGPPANDSWGNPRVVIAPEPAEIAKGTRFGPVQLVPAERQTSHAPPPLSTIRARISCRAENRGGSLFRSPAVNPPSSPGTTP